MPNVYTISPTRKFLPELAAGIFEMAGGIGPDLTRFRILLPTRRACRELRAEFLNLSNGKPLLLPRMNPLGDIDQEELDLLISGTVEAQSIETIPPALSSLERQMMLSTLVQAKNPDMRGEQCLSLARALGRLMDQVYTEDLDLSELPHLVDKSGLSEHWLQTVDFLKILSETWPLVLAEEGKIDSADRRNRLLKLMAAFWQENPPATPVIAAGSTGSIPATGHLLHVVSGLPDGHVILPGLDIHSDDKSWDHIGETHPQNTMKRLITRMEIERHQMKQWREADKYSNARLDIARAVTCPAETCDSFDMEEDKLKAGLQDVELIEADNSRHEAQVIAIAVRQCLEDPDKKAVIITPDRNLARRISSSLRRWDIHVDDSAGQPLHMKPAGIFINRILNCLIEDFAPYPLLDLLKTSFVANYLNQKLVSEFELQILRGPRPLPGLDGLRKTVMSEAPELSAFVDKLEIAFAPIIAFAAHTHPLQELILALSQTTEILAGETLWASPDGEALALLLSELQNQQTRLAPADLRTHYGYLNQFMSDSKVRPAFGTHPRVTILGQIEARLITADLMIMAGLNEGTWPPEPPADPWMSRPMRKRFKLPPIERQTGLSAHDFVQAFNADKVIMTRAKKIDGTPSVPARWLERLAALLESTELKKDFLLGKSDIAEWAHLIDQADTVIPAIKPEPRPPVEARPKTLGVTGIETLMKNPYQIYARYVLGLKPLNPIDEDVTASDRGEFIHDILNKFINDYPLILPENAEQILLQMGENKLAELGQVSPAWQYWWPRFKNIVPAFLEHEAKWRLGSCVWKTEIKGAHKFNFGGVDFTLTAKADRIDMSGDGAAIIDYKTGNTPAISNVVKGISPQLPLEALLMTKGGFEDRQINADKISLSYWTLTGKRNPLDITILEDKKVTQKKIPVVIGDLIHEAEEGLTKLMTAFMTEVTPYSPVIPTSNRLYDEEKAYKHLARTDEWGIEGDSEFEEAA